MSALLAPLSSGLIPLSREVYGYQALALKTTVRNGAGKNLASRTSVRGYFFY